MSQFCILQLFSKQCQFIEEHLLDCYVMFQSNEETERKAVTKILSRMFSDQGSTLAEQNKPLWNCFIGR
mgnify:CR=1 FL=1